jgi:hypothetical protein
MNAAIRLLPTATHLRLIQPMPQDDIDSTHAPTEASGPPSSPPGRPTIPPPPNAPTDVGERPATLPPPAMTQEELDAEADAIRASLTPAGIAKVAADKLIEMYQYSQRRDFDLLDNDGKLARQQRSLLGKFKTEVVGELAGVVSDITNTAMGQLGEKIAGLARGQTKQGADIDSLKREMSSLKKQVKALEQKVKEIDARSPQPAAKTPAT